MIKKIIVILVVILIGCLLKPPIRTWAVFRRENNDQINIEDILETDKNNAELQQRQVLAHEMAECARKLGYPEDGFIISEAKREWDRAANKILINNQEANYWKSKFNQYPEATYWWLYLTKKLNYNDAVAAGIVGNIMVEVGGKTLNLDVTAYSYSKRYYGSCQWSRQFYPEVEGANLKDQCAFLAKTIKNEIDRCGWTYRANYKYFDFVGLTDPEASALMFAKAYERCSSGSYQARQDCANKAYNYFSKGT